MRRRRFLNSLMGGSVVLMGEMCTAGSAAAAGAKADNTRTYKATVSDTLELTDLADLALNGLTRTLDAEHGYEIYSDIRFDAGTPYIIHIKFDFECQGKWWESYPLLRSIAGGDLNRDIEENMCAAMLRKVGPNGLFYAGLPHMTPWHEGNPSAYQSYPLCHEPFAGILGNCRDLMALITYYQRDRSPVWYKQAQRTSDGLIGIAVVVGEYAYYPDGSCGTGFSYPMSGWKNRIEPPGEHYGGEGSVLCYYGQVIRALTRWAMLSGDERALNHAGKLVNFCQKPKMWTWEKNETPPRDIVVTEQAHFQGHVHGHLAYLRGLLEYAVATDNWRLKEFARSGYEYARAKGLARIGCFGEGCAVADMIGLSIRLCDAGLGDYWDDVSQYVRNQFVEMQFSDADQLRAISEAAAGKEVKDPWDLPLPGIKSTDHVIKRALGMFSGGASPAESAPSAAPCCTGNCTNAIYYAWESILRASGDAAQVNLLLNRASAALDLESHLPYEGKVLLRNKTARAVSVRLPLWANRKNFHKEARFRINGRDTTPIWAGNYATFTAMRPGDTITINFPMPEEWTTYSLDPSWWTSYYSTKKPRPEPYTCHLKGDTCLEVSGPGRTPLMYSLYTRRAQFEKTEAPVKNVTRFVPSMVYRW